MEKMGWIWVVVVTLCCFLVAEAAEDSSVLFGAKPSSLQFDEKIADMDINSIQLEDLGLPVDLDTEKISSSRKVRQAPAPAPTPIKDLNLAPDVSEDYPVVFSIILFLSIILILALIAISVAIATMDPGRDSLIYRVTSAQRFKKEN